MLAASTSEGIQVWLVVIGGVVTATGAILGLFFKGQLQLVKARADELQTQLDLERHDRHADKLASDLKLEAQRLEFEAKLNAQQMEIDVLKTNLIEQMGQQIGDRVIGVIRPHLKAIE